jgi:hypothetical protein
MDENGDLHLRRTDTHTNNFTPPVLMATRSNTDTQWLNSGRAAKDCAEYLTSAYVCKSEDTTDAVLPIVKSVLRAKEAMAKKKAALPSLRLPGLSTASPSVDQLEEMREHTRLVTIKVVNRINALTKRSAADVVSQRLGYESSSFTHPDSNLHVASFLGVVEEYYGEKRPGAQAQSEMLVSRTVEDKTIYYTTSQQSDYEHRHNKLRKVSPYQFVALYRREAIPQEQNEEEEEDAEKKKKKKNNKNKNNNQETTETGKSQARPRGRPRSLRFPFRNPTKDQEGFQMARRTVPHFPVLLGPSFPRRAVDPEQFAKLVLTIFRPHISPADLRPNETDRNGDEEDEGDEGEDSEAEEEAATIPLGLDSRTRCGRHRRHIRGRLRRGLRRRRRRRPQRS